MLFGRASPHSAAAAALRGNPANGTLAPGQPQEDSLRLTYR